MLSGDTFTAGLKQMFFNEQKNQHITTNHTVNCHTVTNLLLTYFVCFDSDKSQKWGNSDKAEKTVWVHGEGDRAGWWCRCLETLRLLVCRWRSSSEETLTHVWTSFTVLTQDWWLLSTNRPVCLWLAWRIWQGLLHSLTSQHFKAQLDGGWALGV